MIAPSVLASNFATIKDNMPHWKEVGIKLLHFDVMDNHFVPNLTFGHQFIKDLRLFTQLPFDVHLMITNPAQFIPLYADAGANYISAHIEAFTSPEEIYITQKYLSSNNILFGLAIKPKTPLEDLLPFLNIVDYIVVMTVEPGFGGQTLIPETLIKLEKLSNTRKEKRLNFKLEVDGGIGPENMKKVKTLGADILVMGSAFFKHPNPAEIISEYQNGL